VIDRKFLQQSTFTSAAFIWVRIHKVVNRIRYINVDLVIVEPTQLGMVLSQSSNFLRGRKQMRDKVITEAARVALARREFQESAADIQRKLNARSAILRRRYHVTDEESFFKPCAVDSEIQKLVAKLEFGEVWRDFVIDYHCLPTVQDDGKIRWALPSSSGNITKVN
jgi:hypothetical protein